MKLKKLAVEFNEVGKLTCLQQNFSTDEELANTLAEILERTIIDQFIKISPKDMAMPLPEQEQFIKTKRAEILSLIANHKIDTSYIFSEENSLTILKEVEEFCKHMDENDEKHWDYFKKTKDRS